jgi:hypothetical protein
MAEFFAVPYATPCYIDFSKNNEFLANREMTSYSCFFLSFILTDKKIVFIIFFLLLMIFQKNYSYFIFLK